MKSLTDSVIIICGIVRNAAKGLKQNIPVINALCDNAKDYRIVIYENDSQDKTKEILIKWADSRDTEKIHILLNDGIIQENTIPASNRTVNPFFSRSRIEKMVFFRNQYMKYVEKQNWNVDYMIVVDLDVEKMDLQGILTSFSTQEEWDAITAFGYSTSPKLRLRYHDTYALTENGYEDIPQTELSIFTNSKKYARLKNQKCLHAVFSAFGGLAIYRFDAIKDCYYEVLPNNDKRVEVRCEHFSLYKQMKKNGFEKVYINPKMILKYQRITLNLILNTIKHKFNFFLNKNFSY